MAEGEKLSGGVLWTGNIQAGDMDRRVTLQRPPTEAAQTVDSAGEPAEEFEDVATVWAAIPPVAGRRGSAELLVALQDTPEAKYVVVIRYRTDVRSGWRLDYKGTKLNIVGPPQEIGRKEGLRLLCSERPDPR